MEHLHIVTDTMAIPVTRCSRDLRYLWVSRPYAAWLGRAPEAIVGHAIREVVGEQAFAALAPYFAQVLAGEVVRYEERVTFPDLGPRWITAVYTPTWDAQGVPDGWVAVVIDIEERKQTEEALRTLNATSWRSASRSVRPPYKRPTRRSGALPISSRTTCARRS